MRYKLIGIILILLSVAAAGYFWHQSDKVESAMLIRQGSNKMTVLQGTKKITANSNQNSFLNNGLVGMWSFNGQDVTDKIYDRSGQNNNGYFGTSTATTSAKIMGKVGQALSFDGVDDVADMGDAASLDFTSTNSFSLSGWIKTVQSVAAGKAASLFGKGFLQAMPAGQGGYGFFLRGDSNSKPTFQVRDNIVAPQIESTVSINDGTWHFVTGVRSGATNTMLLYVDGVLQTSSTTAAVSTYSSARSFGIARRHNGTDYANGTLIVPFSGSIDEVRVYNRALTAAEVTSLWQAGR